MCQHDVPIFLEHLSDGCIKVRVSHAWALQSGEQVLDQTQEQWDVFKHELGMVHISVEREGTKFIVITSHLHERFIDICTLN